MTQFDKNIQTRSTRDYEEVGERAAKVRELYNRRNIRIHPESSLGVLLRDAEKLAGRYAAGHSDASDFKDLFNAAHMDRMASALLLLESETNCDEYLNRLTSANLNFLDRDASQAKDYYWEIEFWWLLKRAYPKVRLIDPPDIILDTPDGELAIACKKIYSRNNAARQLSKAVKQLKPFNGVGIAAINIDDLVPEAVRLRSQNTAEMGRFLDDLNVQFLRSCHTPIRRYFEGGRLSAIAVSTSLIAEITNEGTRLNNARQMTIWAWPNVPQAVSRQLNHFAQVLGVTVNQAP